jgi:hypothetical protein
MGGAKTSPRAEASKASFQRALTAGAKIAFAVNASGAHGKQPGPWSRVLLASLSSRVTIKVSPPGPRAAIALASAFLSVTAPEIFSA